MVVHWESRAGACMRSRHGGGDPLGKRVLTSKYIYDCVCAHQCALRDAGVEPGAPLLQSIATYIELLLRWNRKINLTRITDPQEIVTRNFAESLLAAQWLPDVVGRMSDVGSGAGFPGLALKLVLPRWHVTLIEPTAKKAAFLAEAARTLGLKDVEIERCRWQESKVLPSSIDAVTSRAVGGYSELEEWAKTRLKQSGKLILWLGARDAEEIRGRGGWHWDMQVVPRSRERVVLVGTGL